MEIIINGKRLLNSNMYEKMILTITPVDLSVDVIGDIDIEKGLEKTNTLPITDTMRKDSVSTACYDLADYYKRFGKITSVSFNNGNVVFKNNAQEFVIPYSKQTMGAINLLIDKFNDDRLNFVYKHKDLNVKFVTGECSSYSIEEEDNIKYLVLTMSQNILTLLQDRFFVSNILEEYIVNVDGSVEILRLNPNTINMNINDRTISYDEEMKRYFYKAYKKRLERIVTEEEMQYKLKI